MECPTCGAELAPTVEDDAQAVPGGAVVEAARERALMRIAPAEPGETIVRGPFGARSPLAPTDAGLPARLWRHPAVRAVARAGVGAIALSLGLRLARAVLARAIARGGPRRMAPLVARAVTEHSPGLTRPRPLPRGGEIVETWIYMRQERASH